MKLDLLHALNSERAARRAVVLVTDVESGAQRLVKAVDIAKDPLKSTLEKRLRTVGRGARGCELELWGPDGKLQDVKCVIPDTCYSEWYQVAIDFCRENGQFDPTTMGATSNVGLMAQKAEEYGSHDKTFKMTANGSVRVVDESGAVLMQHTVEEGDIWRGCQAKDLPIQDWVKLAVTRARLTGTPAVFWLDNKRGPDAQLIQKVERYL